MLIPTPGVAQDVWVGRPPCPDLADAVGHHPVPVLFCQGDDLQADTSSVTYLHKAQGALSLRDCTLAAAAVWKGEPIPNSP